MKQNNIADEPFFKKQKQWDEMCCTLGNGKTLKNVMKVLKDLVSDVLLIVSPDDIQIRCFDTSHVAFIQLFLPAAGFLTYEVPACGMLVGVKRAGLVKALQCIPDDQPLTLAYKGGASRLYVRSEKGDKTWEFEVQVIVLEPLEETIDTHPSHECAFCMDAAVFKSDCEKLHSFGELLQISVTAGKCVLACDDKKMEETVIVTLAEGLSAVSGSFSLKYLEHFAAAHIVCPKVQIGLSAERPIYLVYAIEGGGHLMFVLAPKIKIK